jgi:hypothetical protein
MVKLGYDKRKNVYRKSVGFILNKGKKVQKFWALGSDKQKAEIIILKAMGEWANLKALGSSVWTSDALDIVNNLKSSLYENGKKNGIPRIDQALKPKSENKKTISKPLTYHQSIDYYCQEIIPTLNISDQWKRDLAYRLSSTKDALDDLPLNSIEPEHLMQIVNYYKNRPQNKKTVKPISVDTATHYIRAAKRLFDYLDTIEVWEMPKRFEDIFSVNNSDFTPTQSERLKSRKGIQTFTLGELSILYKNASFQLQEWMVTSLNIGATQKELSDLMRGECFLESVPPYVEKVRAKTSRSGEIIGKWILWKETADILRKKLANEYPWEYKKEKGVYYCKSKNSEKWKVYDLQDERIYQQNIKTVQETENRPKKDTDSVFGSIVYLNANGIKIDHIKCSWFRALEKCNGKVRKLSFKYLRKTGAKMISDIAGKEIGKVYLAHSKKEMIDRHYVPEDYSKLADALKTMREKLQPLFETVPSSDK